MQVEGKTAILSGAGSGITLCFAQLLLSKGCNVVIADLTLRPESEALISQYARTSSGAKAVFQKTDVTDWAQMDKMFEVAIQHFGGADIVCPGAGVYEPVRSFHTLLIPSHLFPMLNPNHTAMVHLLARTRDTTLDRQPRHLPLPHPRHQPHTPNPPYPTRHRPFPLPKETRSSNPHLLSRSPGPLLPHAPLCRFQTRTLRFRTLALPSGVATSIFKPSKNQSQCRGASKSTHAVVDGQSG